MLPYFRDLRDNLLRIEQAAAGFADQILISFDLFLSKSDYEATKGSRRSLLSPRSRCRHHYQHVVRDELRKHAGAQIAPRLPNLRRRHTAAHRRRVVVVQTK